MSACLPKFEARGAAGFVGETDTIGGPQGFAENSRLGICRKKVPTVALRDEVSGPLGLIVAAENEAEFFEIAGSFPGQLTTTLHMDPLDAPLAHKLLPVLERMAGRILANSCPTGVEVCDAMVHGGPYPASTNFGATSVGTLSIRRWLRPVCFQNIPEALLPTDCVQA